jgi:hypothetical protein
MMKETTIPVAGWSYLADPVRVSLTHCHLLDRGGSDEEAEDFGDEPEIAVSLGLLRRSALHLSVALRVQTPDDAPVHLDVTYTADYEMDEGVSEEQRDTEWRHIAYSVSPGLLYPYLRELISNITSRWRGGPIVLPLIPLPIPVPEDARVIPQLEEPEPGGG